MGASSYLTVLTVTGLAIGFVGALISQISQTSVEGPGGKKILTAAGKLAVAVAAVGFTGSFASELLKASMAAAEVANLKLEHALQEQRRRDDNLWKTRSEAMTKDILAKTETALSKQELELEATMSGFQKSQEQHLLTRLAVIDSRTRILSPIGEPGVTIWLAVNCRSQRFAQFCERVGSLSLREQLSGGPEIWSLWPSQNHQFRFVACVFNTKSRADDFIDRQTNRSTCDTEYAITAQSGEGHANVNLDAVGKTIELKLIAYKVSKNDISGDGKTESMDDLPERVVVLLSYGPELVDTSLESIRFFNDSGRSLAWVSCPTRYFKNTLQFIFNDQPAKLPAFECLPRHLRR